MNTDYVCDDARHLICVPYSVKGLHEMATALGIKRCWFHSSSRFPHYDIPKRRIAEIKGKCRVVSTIELLALIKSHSAPVPHAVVVIPEEA